MSALPEIPDEALAAALREWFGPPEDMYAEGDPRKTAEIRVYVAAAWPHLYAAALRDAADRFGEDPDIHDAPYLALLRQWADDADPKIGGGVSEESP